MLDHSQLITRQDEHVLSRRVPVAAEVLQVVPDGISSALVPRVRCHLAGPLGGVEAVHKAVMARGEQIACVDLGLEGVSWFKVLMIFRVRVLRGQRGSGRRGPKG